MGRQIPLKDALNLALLAAPIGNIAVCMRRVSAQQESSTRLTGGDVSVERRAGALGRLLEENGTLVLVVAAFAAVLVTNLKNALAADGWMALLSGRVVAQHGLPSHETITIWAHGRHWIDQQWLAQLALYGLDRLGGLQLVLLVHAALVTAGLAAAAVLARRVGGSARSATWVALPVLVAFWPGAAVMRPQSFAYLLFVAVLWLLLDDLRLRSRRVFFVLPVLVLWANLHGSVIVGSALASGYGFVELAESLWKERSFRARSVALLAAPWLCMLASPYATSLPRYYHEIFSSSFGSYVTEWAPTTLTLLNAPVYILGLGGLWLLGRSPKATSTFEKIAFVGVSLLAFDAVRNMVWLALFSLVLLPKLTDTLRAPAVEPKAMNRLLALAMLAGVVVATLGVALKPASWFTQQYPPAAEKVAAALAGAHGEAFANESYADWLVFEHPQLAGRIAYDSRFELLTNSQLRSVTNFRNLVSGWRSTIRGYEVLVLDKNDDRLAIRSLLKARRAQLVARRGPVVVLRQRR